MTTKTPISAITEAGAVELDEAALAQVTGGVVDYREGGVNDTTHKRVGGQSASRTGDGSVKPFMIDFKWEAE